jgi:hypothetical protein
MTSQPGSSPDTSYQPKSEQSGVGTSDSFSTANPAFSMTAMGHTRHLHDVRAMSACAPTPDISLRRTNRRNGSKPGKSRGTHSISRLLPIADVWRDGHLVNKPKIAARPEINTRRDDA